MSVIYFLIPIAVILTIIGIYLFFWAVKTEQFNDLEKQGLSILFDDESNQADKADKKAQDAQTQNATQETSSSKEVQSKGVSPKNFPSNNK